ncbi:retrotransposon-related protein [Tanacetum coccineum]
MVNSRQLVAQIDDSLKNHIAEAIATAMATVTKTIEDQVNKSIDAMNESVKGVYTRQDFLCAEMKKLSGEASTSTAPIRPNHPKVDAVEEDQNVKLASMHLYDKALAWHQQYSKMYGEDMLWEVYVKALLKWFCSTYEDPMTDLKNISQKRGFVQVYIDAFDVLMTKVEVHESQAVSFCLGGLDKDIEMSVRIFKPQSLADAYCLSKLQEAKNNVSKKYTKPLLPTPRYNQSYHNTFAKPNSPQVPSAIQNFNRNKLVSNTVPYRKQLTQKELDEKRSKNQCFYCDQKYVPGHKYSGKLYSLEIVEDIGNYEDENEEQFVEGVFGYEDNVVENRVGKSSECQEEIDVAAQPHISLNAISGVNTFQTMRVKGHINNQPINILIDCGSTHNFLDITTAKQIGCPVKESYPLQVTVPGGNFLTSSHACKGLTWKLQGETFQSNMMLIPLGRKVAIRGAPQPALQWMQGKQLSAKLFSMALCVYPTSGVQVEFMNTEVTTKPNEVHSTLSPLLQKYEKVFSVPTILPPHRKHDHKIALQDHKSPINIRPYRHPPTQKDAIEAMVTELLESGVIRESHSPFSSPFLMVKKKDGTWRMCVDYRALNKKTMKDKFPIPIIEELIDELFGAQVFTKLDLRSGYHQIRMCEDDVHKTAFRTHQGHYEFLVMPFGLTNAPSSFQALMNEVFAPFLRKFVLVFFDDILVYSKDMGEHAKHLEWVLQTMQAQQLYAKMSKCVFGTTQVEYLGHVITGEGVSTDSSKVKARQDWPIPVNIKKLRGFLGLTGYYRRFIKNYAAISKPLTALLKKNAFEWS